MQIRENLLRVIFMLSTIVVVTDCCSSRILLLKEHTLQIVNEQRFQGEDYDYDHDDYDQLQLQQQQQQQQQQQHQLPKIPQHIVIASNIEFNRNYTDAHTSAGNTDDPGGQAPPAPDLQISLGIYDPTAFETTASSSPALVVGSSTADADAKKLTPDAALHVVDIMSIPCSGQYFTDFCLNRGRCFRYLVGNDTLHSCICADGYVGERCESKSYNGAFIPAIASANKQRKILMARIVFSFPMLVAISVIYIMIGAAIVFKRAPKQPHAVRMLDEQERMLLSSAYMD